MSNQSTKDVLSILLLYFICMFVQYIHLTSYYRKRYHECHVYANVNYIVLIFSFQLYYTEKCFYRSYFKKKKKNLKRRSILRVGCIERENCAVITNNGWYVVIVKRFI